ncbi:helix-loop-helix DNA-binding domain protein [Gigaspora margarita]|uniref:Helix-loop-helix DNA-binding domain protein n=1 Tax=Gigaspora margarita TaxID=4874 RepID=A0A8H3ZYJ2_GIGMA|nr:helix-loop-helix DNA-binding domain protein [Gigaspora margarita]
MSFQTNSESVLRYSAEQMQHDGLLNEQENKFLADFFNTLATEEPPSNMMDLTPAPVPFPDAGPQSSVPTSRGFPPGFGQNFESGAGYPGYIYQPVGSDPITIPANNGYSQPPNLQQALRVHNTFVQPSYPLSHQIQTLSNGVMHNGGKSKSITGNQSSPLYIKTEPININRRQRSPSPQSSSISKQPLKRTPSRRKSIKNDSAAISLEAKQEEGSNSASSTTHSQSLSSASGINGASTSSAPGSPKILLTPESNNNQSPSTPAPNRRGKKGHHELLTEAEKKANHIASEQKRRQNIRLGFDQLVEIVPTLSQCHRSEALILQKSVEYIQQLLMQKNELKERVKSLQATLGDAPDHLDDSSSDGELDLIF